jgi:hypothetical protein
MVPRRTLASLNTYLGRQQGRELASVVKVEMMGALELLPRYPRYPGYYVKMNDFRPRYSK